MAGLFGGLFNYDKEGPGIEKDAPKKRAPIVFFEIYGRKFWDLFVANLLFLLMNLPIVTRGLADVGLCKITRNYAREKHAFVTHDFFKTIKENWRQALPIGIINLLVTAVLIYNAFYYLLGLAPELWGVFGFDTTGLMPMQPGVIDYVVMAVTVFGYLTFTWMKYYIPMMVVTFKLDTKTVYMNAFKFAVAGVKQNLLISVILIALYAVAAALMLAIPSMLMITLVAIACALLLPSLRSLLIQFIIFPLVKKTMIDPYYAMHPDADKQLRRDLNLDVEETAAEKQESVFEDKRLLPKEDPTVPRQYSEGELRKGGRSDDDDDDTI